jgi:hypothetical protein
MFALQHATPGFRLGEAIWIFLVSVFIEVVIPFSSIGSDTFKTWFYRKLGVMRVVEGIVLFRIAHGVNYIAILLLVLLSRQAFIVIIVVALAGLLFINNLLCRTETLSRMGYSNIITTLLLTCSGHALALLSDLGRISLLLMAFGAAPSIEILLWYLVAHVLGMISQLPLGIGVKDIGLYFILLPLLETSEIFTFLLLLRFSGEGFSALLGYVLGAGRLLRQYRVAQSEKARQDSPPTDPPS